MTRRKTRTLTQRDPRKTGGRYLCGYWRQEYTVISAETRHGVLWLTVQWHDWTVSSHPRATLLVKPHVTTHCTAWDPCRDVILGQPADHTCAYACVCACPGDDEHCECDALGSARCQLA
jgi:hypothetical protein